MCNVNLNWNGCLVEISTEPEISTKLESEFLNYMKFNKKEDKFKMFIDQFKKTMDIKDNNKIKIMRMVRKVT